ncbi:beta strand repeat-containing protein [Zobellia nedashkovskayae]|uniref:beta strand repeat-containing protein n=1 Tax=Zobellia nedashkovskayae TaxID=2779510 RepID=UPI00188B4235|nr:hypothetical protein [Zobellia nedashkovskayae]
MKRIITLLVFLISGLTFAQTTVSLEDQCNCEVLSGTDVTAPGLPTPAGADIGDIYVNTDTGTIYFWDGDSWELTSSDDQQLQNFTFDNVSGELSLTLENGGTATVTLPVETITTLTGTAALGNAIGVYENENGDLVTINETITTISDAGDGNITLTNESGATVTVAKSDITDLGGGVYQFTNGDGTDVTIDTNGMSIDNVILGNRIATVNEADGSTTDINETITNITGTSTSGNEIGLYEKEDGTTVSIQESIVRIEDNNDGNITLVNEAGNSVTVAKSDITDLGGGLYRFTNGDGTDVDINTNGIAITDVVAGNLIATVTQADGTFTEIDETITNITGTSTSGNEIGLYEKEDGTTVSIQESIVRIEDNNDGNITLVNEAGNSVTVAKSDITDLGGGLYRFTNGDGTDVDINTNGIAITDVVAGNLIATVTQADGTFTEIDETITNITGTSTSGNEIGLYEKEDGTTVSIQESIVRIEDNNDGNITLVNEAGNSVTVAKSDITDLGGGLYRFTNGDGTDVDINTNGIAITDVVAGNLIATVTQADGTFTEIDETITNITGTSTSGNEIGLYEKEDGTTVSIQESIVRIEDNNDGNITLVNEAGNSVTVAKSDITDLGGGIYQFTNGDGTDVTIDTNGMSIDNVILGNRIATVNEADGSTTDINETITNITGTSTSGNEIGLYEKEDGTTVSIQESIVRIEDNNDGNITLVNEAGNSVTVAKSDITDLGGGLYRFTNGDGTDVDINTNGIAITDVVAGNLIATVTQADGTFTEIDETITTLSTADSVNYTYTSENGTPTSFDGTDDQEATEVNLTTPLDVDGDSVDETTVEEAIIDLAANASDNQNLTGATLSGTNQLQIDIERGTSTSVDLSSLVETVIAGTGAISVADDGNGNYTVTSTDPDEDETNELTLIDSGAPVVTPSNAGVTYVDDVAGQLYVFDGTTWQQVGGSAAPDADPDPNNELQTLTSTDGSVTLTPSGNDYDLSVAVVDGTETKVESGNANVTVSGDGSTANPYQISSVDLDEQNATEVLLNAPFDVDGDSVNETTVQEALEDLATNASDNQQVSSAVGTPNETVDIDLERGGSTTINIQDADSDATNEIQDATEVALNTPFDVDGDTVNETTVQEALEDLAANASDNQQVSSAVGTPNETVDIDLERGGSTTINIQDADADATNEIQDATEVLLNTPFDVDGDTVNETTVQEALEDIAANASDDQTLSTDGNPGNVSISEGNAINLNVDDADANASNEIQTLTSTDGSVTLTPSGNDYDLSVAVVDGTETKVESGNANVTVSGDGSTASPYQISSVDLDEQNATEVLLDAPFDVDGDTVNETTVQEALEDLAANASDNQQVSSAVGTPNETVDIDLERGGSTTINIQDADADVTNELTLLGNGSPTVTPSNSGVTYVDEVAGQLYVYDGTTWNAVGGNASPDLDGDPNNEIQTITSTDGSITVSPSGNDYDLSVAAADGSETIVNGAGINVVSGSGTSADPYLVTGTEVDGDITNEIQTLTSTDGSVTLTPSGNDYDLSVAVVDGTETKVESGNANVTVTGDGSTASPYQISSVDLDEQNATEVLLDAPFDVDGDSVNETTVQEALEDLATNASDNQQVSSAVGTPNETVDIDLERGGSTTINIQDADADATNEIQALTSTDGSVTLTPSGDDYDLSVAAADGSETEVTGAGINTVTGDGTSASPYVVTGTEVDGDITNEIQTLTSTDGSVTLTPSGDDYDLSVAAADGSETEVTGAGINTVSGDGTSASPYVVTGTEVDGDITNEIQTVASADGSVDVVRTGDDFDLSITIPANNDNDVSVAAADGTETIVQSGNANVTVTGDGSTASPYQISSVDNVDDADADATNEYNQTFAVVGNNLTLTDGGGPLNVPLSSLGTDDQFDDEVELRTPIDVDEGGVGTPTLETNVEEVIQAIAPITSKAARIFYPPSIEVDASTNGTGRTIDLHAQYVAQYGSPMVASVSAPAAIPTYTNTELYYYVTFYDTAVFANVNVNAAGVMTYDVIGQPASYNSLINVVFVVK